MTIGNEEKNFTCRAWARRQAAVVEVMSKTTCNEMAAGEIRGKRSDAKPKQNLRTEAQETARKRESIYRAQTNTEGEANA